MADHRCVSMCRCGNGGTDTRAAYTFYRFASSDLLPYLGEDHVGGIIVETVVADIDLDIPV